MVAIKNISGSILRLHLHEFDINELYHIEQQDLYSWSTNDDVIGAITTNLIQICNDDGSSVGGYSKQIDYLKGRQPVEINNPKSLDGKLVYHTTPRQLGTYAYYTGSSDDINRVFNVGGSSDDSELICGKHNIGNSSVQVYYKDINTIANESFIRTGLIQWQGANNDHISLEIVPRLTSYVSASNTNFNIYAGTLIIPAAGDGLVYPTDVSLVQCVQNEFGKKPAGFWDADFNHSSGIFENLRAAPQGNGNYNMFVNEMVLSRFVNKFMLLGDGVFFLPSDDITQLPHGVRLKITTVTRGEDHVWSWNANLHLYRKKTC